MSTEDSKAEPEFEVPIRPIEEALGVPLQPKAIERLQIVPKLLEKLYYSLKSYHQCNRIVPDSTKFRPNISFAPSISYTDESFGVECHRDFDGYIAGDYLRRNVSFTIPYNLIKSSLLFAHEVVIEDALFARCRFELMKQGSPNLEWLREVLLTLAELRPLMEARLLRITAFFPELSRGVLSHPRLNVIGYKPFGHYLALTRFQNRAAIEHAAKAMGIEFNTDPESEDWPDNYMSIPDSFEFNNLYLMSESMAYASDDGIPFQAFLRNDFQLEIFTKLVKNAPEAVLGDAVRIMDLLRLNSYNAVIPDKVSIFDLVRIRFDEEVFEHWRSTVNQCLALARQHVKGGFSESSLFHSAIRDAENQWNASFSKHKNKSRFLNAITTDSHSMVVGGVGAALGAVLTGANPLIGAAAALAGSAAGVLTRVLSQCERYDAERSAASFFMAMRTPH